MTQVVISSPSCGKENALSLTLYDVALRTWDRLRPEDRGRTTFADYCRFLLDNRGDVYVTKRDDLLIARQDGRDLYVSCAVGDLGRIVLELIPAFFNDIVNVKYLRRGKPQTRNYKRLWTNMAQAKDGRTTQTKA